MEAKPARKLSAASNWAVGFLCLTVLADSVALVIEVDYLGVLQDLHSGVDLSFDEVEAADNREAGAALFQSVAYLGAIIAFLVWFRRAYRNLGPLGAGTPRFAYGWAVGAWFVPILNLWRPKQIANDIWRASDPDLPPGDHDWGGRPVPALLHWWWAFFLLSDVVGNISVRLFLRSETLSEQITASQLSIATDAVSIVAAVLAILVVRAITRRQDERIERQAGPLADSSGPHSADVESPS